MISVIIPSWNEAAKLEVLLEQLRDGPEAATLEILVVDGGSEDDTLERAQKLGVRTLRSKPRGRAAQMNAGAAASQGEILWFLHADCLPGEGSVAAIQAAYEQGQGAGCFRLAFDSDHWLLRFSAWMTRLPWTALRFGDQSLFVSRERFAQVGGFDEKAFLLEDQDMVHRLKKGGPFVVLKPNMLSSARRYRERGVIRLQWRYLQVWLAWRFGAPQHRLQQILQKE